MLFRSPSEPRARRDGGDRRRGERGREERAGEERRGARPARRRGKPEEAEAPVEVAAVEEPVAARGERRPRSEKSAPRPAPAPAPTRAPVTPLSHRRSERAPVDEPADTSHLPAFLLRPVKIKAG